MTWENMNIIISWYILVRLDAGKLAESRGGKTSRTQEKGKATAKMGGLCEEGYEKIGGG